MPEPRPTAVDREAAREKTIPDVLAPRLRVLFCGINPGLWSAATGHHFARPGNRFWPALHRSGFTPEQLSPSQQRLLLDHGIGLTNLAARATARADELTAEELYEGSRLLRARVAELRPAWLAVLGVTAYRTAFAEPKARVGPQEGVLHSTRVWVLPNPSGLNAHWPPPALAEEFARLREAAETPGAATPEDET